jgi:hypothetical protein
MAADRHLRHVEVTEDGQTVALADIQTSDDDVVRADLHIEPGQVPSGTGRRLVDAVLDAPETRGSAKLEATLQMGDSESLGRLRECCGEVHAHPAGASCLVDVVLPDSGDA